MLLKTLHRVAWGVGCGGVVGVAVVFLLNSKIISRVFTQLVVQLLLWVNPSHTHHPMRIDELMS